MLSHLIEHTDFIAFLSRHELSQLRQVSVSLKKGVEQYFYPHTGYTWVEKCRFYDPTVLWRINNVMTSCYTPKKKEWTTAYWQPLPSVVPTKFWNLLLRFLKPFVSMSNLQKWCNFSQSPLVSPFKRQKWEIGVAIDIVGGAVHNEEDDYPENLNDIDEFISVGVCIHHPENIIEDHIVGLNDFSIGWHSEDGYIYTGSLLVGECEKYRHGDRVEVILDYANGIIFFRKNNRLVYIYELMGYFLCNPLVFCVSCTTMNKIYFSIV